MQDDAPHKVTRLLEKLRAGHHEVAEELADLVYSDLLRIAERRMRGCRDATLEPSALVNECWIRIGDQRKDFQSRSQFLAIASRIMLRVLLDADRRRASLQRGGDRERVTLSFEFPVAEVETGVETRLLHEALERFDAAAPRKAEVARLRGLAGLTTAETAVELGVSSATVERDWAFARAWLSREVQRLQAGSDGSGEVADPVPPES